MSLTPKTERNLAGNIPVSRSALSIKSIIKDLQELDKSLTTKKEFEEMKMELKGVYPLLVDFRIEGPNFTPDLIRPWRFQK